jgi:hypothetical protein
MICTQCSRPIRPVVALDIDGTLGDYHGHLLDFALSYLGYGCPILGTQPSQYDGSESYGDWMERAFGIDRRTYRDIKLAYRQGAQKRSMPVEPGARELTEGLRAAGAEVWIATSRPYLRLDSVDPDTREWLKRNRLWYDHIIYGEDKYDLLAQTVDPARVVAVLDDLPEQYDGAARAFGQEVPLLKRSLWNRAIVRRYAIEDLGAARQIIGARLDRWYEQNHLRPTA